jgi:hypothetical protein
VSGWRRDDRRPLTAWVFRPYGDARSLHRRCIERTSRPDAMQVATLVQSQEIVLRDLRAMIA